MRLGFKAIWFSSAVLAVSFLLMFIEERKIIMLNQFSRTELLLGKEAMEKLGHSRVAVFGVGGVGGYVCEALVRSGVGAFDLIDDDRYA
mgnify:CR=1 FL=1